LWFPVDLPNRQRYFFICGFKQVVKKKAGGKEPPIEAAKKPKKTEAEIQDVVFDAFCIIEPAMESGQGGSAVHQI
jgi:hypothetical protein